MEERFSKHSIAKFLEEVAELEQKFSGNEVKVNESDPNETLNELYVILQKIELIKAQSDFLFSHFSFVIGCDKILISEDNFSNSTFATEQYLHVEDFEEISYYLFDLKIRVKANIDILEDKEGHKYWILNRAVKKYSKNNKDRTDVEIHDKKVVSLILFTAQNILFDRPKTSISNAVEALTGFSSSQIRKSSSENKVISNDVRNDAIEKLEQIILALKK